MRRVDSKVVPEPGTFLIHFFPLCNSLFLVKTFDHWKSNRSFKFLLLERARMIFAVWHCVTLFFTSHFPRSSHYVDMYMYRRQGLFMFIPPDFASPSGYLFESSASGDPVWCVAVV